MYAITFSLDFDSLQLHPGASVELIAALLEAKGIVKHTPGFHLGGSTLNAVNAVLAVQAVGRELPWFAAVVEDLRLIRVEANDDLKLALAINA